jgi:O-antigen ligase
MNTSKEIYSSEPIPTNFLFISLFVLFVVSALPFINPLTPRLNSDFFAFIGLGLFGLATYIYLPRPATDFGLTSLSLLCGGWWIWAFVQYIAGVNTTYFSYLLVSTSYLLAVVLLCAWVKMWVRAGQGELLAQSFMGVVLIAGLLQAAGIWLQMFQLQDFLSPWLNKSSSFPRHGGFLSQPNLCASLIVGAIVSLVFLHPEQGQHSARPQPWRLFAMGFMMLAVYATSSRTGYLELLLVSGLLALMRQRLNISWVWVALIVWQLIAIALGELLANYGLMSGQLLEESRQAVEASGSHRLRILSDVWLVIQQHPLMGVGWRQLQVAEVLTPGIMESVDHAHNLIAQIQVELGILGTLSLLVFAAYWLFKKRPWQTANGPELAMVCMVMILGLHSMLEYPLWHALFLFIFVFAFSLLPEDTYAVRLPLLPFKVLAIVLLIGAAWFYVDHRKTLTAYERFSQNRSVQEFLAAKKAVWWNQLLFQSVLMIDTEVNDRTLADVGRIAKENANVFSQSLFLNLPLLKVKIFEGETAVANQLAIRMCMNFPKDSWAAVQAYLMELNEPRYLTWLAQLPANARQCKD